MASTMPTTSPILATAPFTCCTRAAVRPASSVAVGSREMADRFEAPVGGVVAEAAGRLGTSVAEIGQRPRRRRSWRQPRSPAAPGRRCGPPRRWPCGQGPRAAAFADLARTATDEAGRTAALVQQVNGAVAKIGDRLGDDAADRRLEAVGHLARPGAPLRLGRGEVRTQPEVSAIRDRWRSEIARDL
jgi:hypothetical protein